MFKRTWNFLKICFGYLATNDILFHKHILLSLQEKLKEEEEELKKQQEEEKRARAEAYREKKRLEKQVRIHRICYLFLTQADLFQLRVVSCDESKIEVLTETGMLKQTIQTWLMG